MNKTEFRLSPIGAVHAGEGGYSLTIDPAYVAGLQGLDGFSHLNVLWWCHFLDDAALRAVVELDQPYKTAPAKLGVFATRSPVRPNPIALSTVAVTGIDHGRGLIHVAYIDAEDGTPILDIKPYQPSVDRVKDMAVPDWCSHWPLWLEESAAFDWDAEFVTAR